MFKKALPRKWTIFLIFLALTSVKTVRSCANNEQRPENQAACAGQTYGKHVAYPGNCSLFLVCTCEYPTVMECSSGLWWDTKMSICNYPQDVECNQNPTTMPTTTDSNDSDKDCILPDGISKDICLNYEENILLNYPYNCNAYVNCTKGCPVLKYCPVDKEFNVHLKICDLPEMAQCEELPMPGITTTPQECIPVLDININICANQKQDSVLQFSPNCSNYILCKSQCPSLEYCKNDKLFNDLLGICDNSEDVICGELSSTTTRNEETTPTVTTMIPPVINPDFCINQPDFTIFPYELDCSKYIQCLSEEYELKSCPHEWVFNTELKLCDTPSEEVATACQDPVTITTTVSTTLSPTEKCKDQDAGITFPFEPNCQQYIYCKGPGDFVIMNCPNNNYYHADSGNCGPSNDIEICLKVATTTTTTTAQTTTSETALPTVGLCYNKKEGELIVYPNNCQKYISCIKPIPIAFSCNHNWYFEVKLQKCIPDIEGSCQGTTIQQPNNICQNLKEGDWEIYANNCQLYYKCLGDGYYMLKTCLESQYFDPIQGHCSSQVSHDYCLTSSPPTPKPLSLCDLQSPGRKVAYPNNCFKYIKCESPIPYGYQCPSGLQFSLELQDCVEPRYSDCGVSYNACTDKPKFTLLPYKDNCSRFLICIQNWPYLAYCNENQNFDSLAGECLTGAAKDSCKQEVFKTMNTAKPKTITSITETSSLAIDSQFPTCFEAAKDTKISYPFNCDKYIECNEPIPVAYECPDSLEFSEYYGKCFSAELAECSFKTTTTSTTYTPTTPSAPETCDNKPTGTTLPYYENCAKYYMCLNFKPKLINCMPNSYYDPSSGECGRDISSTACQEPPKKVETCDYQLNGYSFAYPQDCSKFYICLWGSAFACECSEQTYYNSLTRQCDRQITSTGC